MAYKIFWNDGGSTAEAYSSKKLATNVLKGSKYKGRIAKFNLGSETKSPLGYNIVWTEYKSKYGKVYRTRNPTALQQTEKVVRNWWKI